MQKLAMRSISNALSLYNWIHYNRNPDKNQATPTYIGVADRKRSVIRTKNHTAYSGISPRYPTKQTARGADRSDRHRVPFALPSVCADERPPYGGIVGKENRRCKRIGGFGATDPIRTDDLLITSELLYLLSHSSTFFRTEHSITSLRRLVKRFLHFLCGYFFRNFEKRRKNYFLPLTKENGCGIVTVVGFGRVPEWPKGTDCKSAGFAFGGSNPPSPTKSK